MTGGLSLRLAALADAASECGAGRVFRCMALTGELRWSGAEAFRRLADLRKERGGAVWLLPYDLMEQADAASAAACAPICSLHLRGYIRHRVADACGGHGLRSQMAYGFWGRQDGCSVGLSG